MTIVFEIPAQKYLNKAFLVPNLGIVISFTKFCNQTNSRTLISNMIIAFSNFSPKIPKSDRFGPKFKGFYFCTNLCNKTNSKAPISNMTIVYHPNHPNYTESPKQGIFDPRFRDFHFTRNFALRKIQGCCFQIWQYQIPAQKYLNKPIFVLNLIIFIFA